MKPRTEILTRPPDGPRPDYVVGIGASAGGLTSLEALVAGIAEHTESAFIVLQHLSSEYVSHLDEVLIRRSSIPVIAATDGCDLEPGVIYVVPSVNEAVVESGRIQLVERSRSTPPRSIDRLLVSLSRSAGPRAVAIILSGTGADGSRGIRQVHRSGGLVLVEPHQRAAHPEMPRSALESGLVHEELAPARMAGAIADHARSRIKKLEELLTEFDAANDHARAFDLLERRFGIDTFAYQPTTLLRRVGRRARFAEQEISSYVDELAGSALEQETLYQDLFIGVSAFFRDPGCWEHVESTLIPELLERGHGRAIRVWVAGCAAGEEAYTWAILLEEAAERHELLQSFQIVASDIHTGILADADAGLFRTEQLENLTPERRDHFFTQVGEDQYRVSRSVRRRIVFARQDLLRDAPFSNVDVISCRNVFIYLRSAARERVLTTFAFGLRQGGYLVLGSAESTSGHNAFEPVDVSQRVYRATGPMSSLRPGASSAPGEPLTVRRNHQEALAVYDRVLEVCMPPSFLLDRDGSLVEAFGGAARLLTRKTPAGARTVFQLLDSPQASALMEGLEDADQADGAVFVPDVEISAEGQVEHFTARFRRLPPTRTGDVYFLFELAPTTDRTLTPDAEEIRRLEVELREARQAREASVEALEGSNQELQTTNEELMASNEELQATNEELHAVNEELYAVNVEHEQTINELRDTSADLDGVLRSLDQQVVLLTPDLRVRRFTDSARELFSLQDADLGRPLKHLVHQIDCPDLHERLERVVASGDDQLFRTQSLTGGALAVTIRSLRDRDDVVTGVAIVVSPLDTDDEAPGRDGAREGWTPPPAY